MISLDNEDNSLFSLGDYVRVKTEQELLESSQFVKHSVTGSILHVSGEKVSLLWYGREGYITGITYDSRNSRGDHFYQLDSGPFVPEEALIYLKHKTGCECGQAKHGFDGHSTWCPKFESVWNEFPDITNTGWSR